MMDIIAELQNKDDKKAYELFRELNARSTSEATFYPMFDDFVSLINSKSSYVRTRGFCLAIAQARWDKDDKIKRNWEQLALMLHDEKPIAVRQCLAALHEVVLYKPELNDLIKTEIQKIDLSQYKDTMAPLIKKDIESLLKLVA